MIKLVAAKRRVALPGGPAIDAEVDLGFALGVYHLAARLNVRMLNMHEETARLLVEAASQACPYPLATSGNIDVHNNVTTSEPAAPATKAQLFIPTGSCVRREAV